MTNEHIQELMAWLEKHETDIAEGADDFGDLEGVFFELFNRHAGESPCTGIQW